MAGFEVVVRPAILPDIRPARQPRMPVPQPGTDQNMVVLSGGGAQMIDLTTSESSSSSRSKHVETSRTYDVERIYKQDDDGTVDESQFVDTERVRKIETQSGTEKSQTVYATPPERENVKVLETGKKRDTGATI